ncbi:lipopolysaccharide assembly protein LapA domain-containing protein [Pseudoroseicyclus tamaricis]|uniref:LapA family protein n=1 Tax=Pseudoroseicyclus tamaricis TaxID=2705421 RepID=A0A6B2K161_9RHOB|nr:LapA family protein [Pseudoroseicyclus tamaricis]NDV01432.1 LapA family protein [Pseudoroseicyclus tamaricis]
MKTIRYAFWGIVALCLIAIGIANRGLVTVRAMPETLSDLLGVSPDIEVPLFVVIFLGVAAGLLIGFLWEWIRESRYRSEMRRRGREADALRQEVGRLKVEKHEGKDEVLALLE